MPKNTEIKQETWIPHEELSKAMEAWVEESELDRLPENVQKAMRGIFAEGYSACLHHTMAPARDLAMALLQMIQIGRTKVPDNPSLILGGQVLEFIEEHCHKLVGTPEDWQLDMHVDAVEVTEENEAELPEEVREAMAQARKAAKDTKDN